MQDIVILGAGGLARELAFLIEEINRVTPTWNLIGFVERDQARVGAAVGKYTVVCGEEELAGMCVAAAIGIGSPATVQKIVARFAERQNVAFPNLIHPSTVWDKPRIVLGVGNVICAGSIFTTDIRIGSFNYFNLGCTYGHDIEIGDCCVFNPGCNISGGVRVGSGCLIGTGATVLQYLELGRGTTVGAGAVVTKNVLAATTVVGVPAKPIVSTGGAGKAADGA